MTLHSFAVVATAVYFVVFGSAFVFRPATIGRLGLQWTDAAGKTEVRCYYGAISWAIAAFVLYLLGSDLAAEALTGVIILASSVFLMRVVGATVDGGWGDTYNRQAIPIEAAFVAALVVCRVVG